MPGIEHWETYLAEIHEQYEKEKNPLFVLDALLISWKAKLPLPFWAHEILGFAAHCYLMKSDNKSFDELLGLNAKKGRDNQPIKKRRNKELYGEVAYRVAEANKRYGFTLPVSYWLISKTGVDDKFLSMARIEEIYKTEDNGYDFIGYDHNFTTCGNRGYFDAIFDSEEELKRLGLYDSAIKTIKKMLKRGE